jgi:diguanylate cyclase (GGDEF)-like protein
LFITILLFVTSLVLGLLLFKRNQQYQLLKNRLDSMEQQFHQQIRHREDIVKELEQMNQQTSAKQTVDPLTGLPNRQAFEDRLSQLINYSQRLQSKFAVMILDIDQFGVINNKLGYDLGDKLLAAIARRLQAEIRQIDTVAWLGSGKFLFLFPQLDKGETAAYVAQRIQDAIIHSFNIDGQELYIRASMGIAVYPADGENLESLLKNADKALSASKENGGNIYQFYHPSTNALGQREIAIKNILLSNNFLEKLSVDYQFYFHNKTKKVELIHAKAKLEHPDLGDVTYMEFSKIAENNNKSLQVSEWLLNQAIVRFQQSFENNVTPKHLLVTLTLKQIQHPHFPTIVAKALQEHVIGPNQLVFEINDQHNLLGFESIEKNITALSQLGVGIAVSVFGLGHFAIQKVTSIPINYLKIDGQLIKNLVANKENKFILNMMIANAIQSNISVIAEGVEDENQLSLLIGLGCEIMQGSLPSLTMAPLQSAALESVVGIDGHNTHL